MVGAFADLQEALDAIASSTRAALGCQKAVIFELVPATNSLTLVAAQGLTPTQMAQLRSWTPDPAGPTATATGRTWSVRDTMADPPPQLPFPFAEVDGLRTWVEVPLRGKEGILGSLLAGYDQTHQLTVQEEELLSAFAAQAAVTLETARLAQKTERRARELSTLYEVGQVITSSLELDTVLDRIMHQAMDLLEVEAGSLVLIDTESEELVFRIALGPTGDQVQGLRLPPGTGVVGQVAASGHPLCVNDAQSDPRFYRGADDASGFQTRSILAVPLSSRDQIIGVIEVMNRTDGRPFLSEQMDLLTAFAAQAAIAIENAQLYQRTDEALSRRVHELTTIAELDHTLSATLDFESVNDLVVDGAMQATNATAGLMAVVDEPGTGLLFLSQRGYPASIRRYQFEPWPVDRGIIGRVVCTGQPALVPDVQLDPDYTDVIPTIRSQLSVPILREDEQVIGVVTLGSDRATNFTTDDLRFVQHLTEHAAIAMQNARLFAELQCANRELQALSDAKTEFVSIVAHELRAPMTSIKGYVDLILEDEEIAEDIRDFLLVVQENTDRLAKLVADLLDVSRIEAGRISLSFQPVCLPDIVDVVVSTSAAEVQEKQLAVTVDLPDDLPLVWGDQDRVTQILTNLMNNAVKYTPEGEVRVSGQTNGDGYVQVAVTDTGIGIAPADQLQLFEKFFRADHPLVRRVPGTGLGLSIVKSLVEVHGGRIWVESQLDEGSTFYFTLPIAPESEPSHQSAP
jgi:signal transduction histidine kinase